MAALHIRPASSPTPYSFSLPEAPTSHGHRAAPPRGSHRHTPSQGGAGGGIMMYASATGTPALMGASAGTSPMTAGGPFGLGPAAASMSKASSTSCRLPQAARPNHHAAGSILNMMIQGHSAGEGRTLQPTEPRVPSDRKPGAALDNGVNKEQRDSTRLRKLEQEIAKLQELLKKRTGERDKANGKVEELEKSLADERKRSARSADADAKAQATILEKGQLIVDLQLANKQLEEKLAKLAAEAAMSRSQNGKAGEELDGLRGALAKEQRERSEMEASLKAQLAELQKKLDDATDKKRRNSNDLQSQIDKLTADLAAKTREATTWETKALKLEKELKSQEASFAEWKARIESINEYILKICQPQFSVVKDETLAPVAPTGDPATSGQDGFVLVPLQLMLQGYGLLPQELKRRIATEYEANKKDGGSSGFANALPRRSSRP